MSGFLYFKPRTSKVVTRADLAEWGVGYAFPKSVASGQCMGETPTRTAGVVFADPQRMGDRPIKMATDEQATWRKLPGSDVWCSYWLDAKPRPADLARSPQLPGYQVCLADGHEWLIPLVRRFDVPQLKTVTSLPCYMECDENGNWHHGPVIERHAHLWDVTAPIAAALLEQYNVPSEERVSDYRDPSDQQILQAVVTLLAENYTVGAGELSLLHVFCNQGAAHAAAMAACDWPTFLAWADDRQKKSESPPAPAGSTTSAGEVV